jgi:hypothetical protein
VVHTHYRDIALRRVLAASMTLRQQPLVVAHWGNVYPVDRGRLVPECSRVEAEATARSSRVPRCPRAVASRRRLDQVDSQERPSLTRKSGGRAIVACGETWVVGKLSGGKRELGAKGDYR